MKQVIVMRTDLGMNKGKMIAQGAHASMLHLLDGDKCDYGWAYGDFEGKTESWHFGRMAKIAVRVDSEQELNEIAAKAREANLLVYEVIDTGKTVFNGVPTKTCCAIGPNKCEEIDKVTGHLKLL